MKKDKPTINPKGAERFTVKADKPGEYIFEKIYYFDGMPYRLASVMQDGDGVVFEFVKVQL